MSLRISNRSMRFRTARAAEVHIFRIHILHSVNLNLSVPKEGYLATQQHSLAIKGPLKSLSLPHD